MNTHERSGLGRRGLAAGVALVFAVGLSGCAVSVRTSDAAATPTSSSPAVEPSASASAESSDSSPSPDASDGSAVGLDDGNTRADAEAVVDQRLTCTGSPFVIDGTSDARVVEVSGECTDVQILASGAVVILPAVQTLSVDGDISRVFVAAAESISFTGDGNTLTWQSGAPSISDSGTANMSGAGR